jgi:ribosomal protein S18 acetylase RimI-like enzyme
MTMRIRPAEPGDEDGLWRVLEPIIRTGETYPYPRDMTRDDALRYWLGAEHEVFVAEEGNRTLGTYYIRPNQKALGSHVANCGYMVAADAQGRGVATALYHHSVEHARARGYRAMQFNLVVATNAAGMHLWPKLGMEIVGKLPGAFQHPTLGDVDAYVMYRRL